MSYNHGKEERFFEQRWKKLRKEYREAGMTEEAIEKIYLFDKDVFNRDRAYFEHLHVSFTEYNGYSDEEEGETLDEPELSVSDELSTDHSRYWWVEEIDNPILAAYIKSLSKDDIELITMYYFEGYNQNEIAEQIGVSQRAVSKRIAKLKKYKKS